jgi:hypothetical protein
MNNACGKQGGRSADVEQQAITADIDNRNLKRRPQHQVLVLKILSPAIPVVNSQG